MPKMLIYDVGGLCTEMYVGYGFRNLNALVKVNYCLMTFQVLWYRCWSFNVALFDKRFAFVLCVSADYCSRCRLSVLL
jgi:hypothetical protein